MSPASRALRILPMMALALAVGLPRAASARCVLDVMVVLDRSGSMQRNDPSRLTPKALRALAAALGPQDRIGLTTFAKRAKVVSGLAEPLLKMVSQTRQVTFNGAWTDIGKGVEAGFYHLKEYGRKDSVRVIVLYTDGTIDLGNSKSKSVRRAEETSRSWLLGALSEQMSKVGVRVFGIAFTDKADYPLLQTLATRTGGDYFRATDTGAVDRSLKAALTFARGLCPKPVKVPATPAAGTEPPPARPTATRKEPAPTPEPAEAKAPRKKDGWPTWLIWLVSIAAGALFVALIWIAIPRTAPTPRPPAARAATPRPSKGGGRTIAEKKACANHPGRAPKVSCYRCKSELCLQCVTREGDRYYCHRHLP